MDYAKLLPPLPEPSNLLFHALDAKVRGHTSVATRDYALDAIAAAAPAIRKAEREKIVQQLDRLGCDHCAAAIFALPEEP